MALSRNQYPLAAILALLIASAIGLEQPDTGGLDTEPGLRLRIYSIGDKFDPALPLQPGQSANVDLTVPAIFVSAGDFFQDDQDLTEKKDEKITKHYIAEWTGWVKIPFAGRYQFEIGTSAATLLAVGDVSGSSLDSEDDTRTKNQFPLEIDAGWQPIRLVQKVVASSDQPISVRWRRLDGSETTIAEPFAQGDLLAPKFYFRPTQMGRKLLVRDGERPGLGEKLSGVHPGYRITNIRPQDMEMPVGGLGMLPDGRLVVARFDAEVLKAPEPTEEPNGELWLISNPTSDDPEAISGEKIADGLYEPSGLQVLEDEIYISQRHEITRFSYDAETNAWKASTVASGWDTNDFHQISAGLPWIPGPTDDHPGYFYMSRGAGLGRGQNPPDHASVWLINLSEPAGENVEVLTGGHRTPNGLGLNREGECFVIDNQGGWTPANEVNHVQKGHFYGFYLWDNPPAAHPAPFQPEKRDGITGVTSAAILLPQNEIGNSPTELLLFPEVHSFAGQMVLGDMRYGGLNRIFLEEIGGVWQGCVMRFTQGLEGGPNRVFFGPDGSLYVGSIGGRHAGTWFWVNPETNTPTFGGLERLTPTGETVFDIDHMEATPDGFLLSFTQPIAEEWLADPENYELAQWTYQPTNKYGGPKIDEQDLEVTRVEASSDGLSVSLTVPGRKEGYCVWLAADPVSRSGDAIWSGEVWYTLNRIPE